MKITKYRAILSRYDPNNLPDAIAVKGIICNDRDEAMTHCMAMIKDLFDHTFTSNICPGMGYNPRFYELDTDSQYPIIWYNPAYGSNERVPVFNATLTTVECTFSDTTNFIEYRAMRINKYQDKWYVSSKFNNQIIGIIDDKTSINDICAAADKIWEGVKIDHKESEVVLSDN